MNGKRDLLVQVGRSLYGELWQSALARDLNISDRAVRQWVAGDRNPSPGVYADLLLLVESRQEELADVAEALKQAIAQENGDL
jgi:DNA-binding transcriptional regulator YiaG